MLYQLEKLNESEKELVLNAPAYITILIAGADDDITDVEIRRSIQLVHIKTYSESVDIQDVYEKIDHDYEKHLNEIIDALPKTLSEREKVLIEKLSGLNAVFSKIDHTIGLKFYNSLLEFASYIAHAAGNVLGIDIINHREKEFVKLPMVQRP